LDGFGVLRWIRDHPEIARSLTVLVLSGREADEDVEEVYTLGAHSFLNKPVEFRV